MKEDHLRLLPFLERVAAHCRKPSESGKPSCTETDTFEDIREREVLRTTERAERIVVLTKTERTCGNGF